MTKTTYDPKYIEFLINFNSLRDYFECHELLEDIWMEESNPDLKKAYQALIQFAVGFYHWRRNNDIGAVKTFEKCLSNINLSKDALKALGLEVNDLIMQCYQAITEIKKHHSYHSIDIKMDEALTKVYNETIKKMNHPTSQPSDLSDTFLVNKHALRKYDVAKINMIIAYMQHFNQNIPKSFIHKHASQELKQLIEDAIKNNHPIKFE